MAIFEILFKISHECPMGNISRQFPDLKMFEWCNKEHEVIELIIENRKKYSAVLNEISKIAEIIDSVSDESKAHLVTRLC